MKLDNFFRSYNRNFSRNVTKNLSVEEMYKFWKRKFIEQKISEPVGSAKNIIAHVLGSTKIAEVCKQRSKILNDNQKTEINKLCEQRLKKMPVQYIIGEWDFRELTVKLRPPVFIPRPETEQLIDFVLAAPEKPRTALDLCCGSGVIALALLNALSQLRVVAVDQNPAACALTKENGDRLGLSDRLTMVQSSVANVNSALGAQHFDVIVSNPPYVPADDMKTLQPEITLYEDLAALDGGSDGLDVIRQILSTASTRLSPGGRLYLEVDPSHPALIAAIVQKDTRAGLRYVATYKDFCSKDRFVEIEKQ